MRCNAGQEIPRTGRIHSHKSVTQKVVSEPQFTLVLKHLTVQGTMNTNKWWLKGGSQLKEQYTITVQLVQNVLSCSQLKGEPPICRSPENNPKTSQGVRRKTIKSLGRKTAGLVESWNATPTN